MTTTKNNIPAGYKDSAVGIIPQEWEVRQFKNCFTVGHGRDYKHLPNGNIPVYGSGGIICYVGSHLHDGETVCIGRKGTINKPFYYNGSIWTVDTLFYTHSFRNILPRYVGYLFDNIDWMRYNEATGVPSLTAKTISNIKLAMPPMGEQRKIAEILGIWDEAIEKQNLLIEKLELRKRALMQRLLTGRIRLPGFIDDVQYKKLKPLIVEKSERNTNQTYTNVLSVTNNRGFINQAEQFDREVASDNTANYKLVHRGQFAYNPSRVNVGSLDLLQTYDLGILSPMYIVFETRPTMDSKFLYYQLKSGWFVGHIPMYVQGSVRDSLSFDGLENMKFWIPSLTEQKAIAEVLNTADKEIAIHSKTLDALRLQKRGLMQQLLTGKTRVKI